MKTSEYLEKTFDEIKHECPSVIFDEQFRKSFKDYLEKQNLAGALLFLDGSIKAQNYVGVIKYKNFQLDILPKLLSKTESTEDPNIVKNLIYMISLTERLNIKFTEHADINHCENPFLEVLIREFAISLFECLKRLTPRNYIREEDNLNYLKGKLKFTENLRYNCANQAKFYCEYDEFSENNKLNQLFLFVSKCLFQISKSSENKKVLSFIMNYFCDLPFVKTDKFKADKIILTRNQKLFEHPFELAKMFLKNISVDISKNTIENITLLWDMNKLFEEFVYEVMKRSDIGYEIHYQEKRKLLKDEASNKKYGATYVDIYLQNKEDKKDKIILDTKYKYNSGAVNDFANSDIYQVCTYCLLHGAKKAILCYPVNSEDTDCQISENRYFTKALKTLELNTENNEENAEKITIDRIFVNLGNNNLPKILQDDELKNIFIPPIFTPPCPKLTHR